MALENIDVLRIDTKEDVNNLRELKAEIKELKATLEELEIGSEEYEKVADRLYNKQQYLADVMKETKRPVEDTAGSINEMNKRLKELTAQWRAADETGREALTPQIVALKQQVNSANESILNFQHNVGNYSNSIIDAFQKMGISVTSLTAPLKKIGLDIESMDTGIKIISGTLKTFSGQNLAMLQQMLVSVTAGTKAFILGLSGIQKALLATGIGAFIVLIGVLIAKWDDWVVATNAEKAALENTKIAIEDLNYEMKDQERLLSYHIEMRKIQGASEQEILEYENEELKRLRDLALAKAEEIWQNMQLMTSEEDLAEARKNHNAAMETYNKLSDRVRDNYLKQSLAYARAQKKAQDEAAAAAKKRADEEKKLFEDTEKAAVEAVNEELARMDEAMEIRKRAAEELKSDKQKEIEAYEKEKKKLEEWNLSTEELTAAHNKKMAQYRQQEAEDLKARELEKLEYAEEMRQLRASRESDPEADSNPWNYDAIVEQNNAEFDAFKTLNEGKIALNKELMKSYEENSEEYQRLQRENEKLDEEIAVKRSERDKANDKAYKNLMKAREEATKSMVSSTSNMFKNLSAAMGESTKMGKGFAIASATIDTIAAAVSGFRAGMNQWKDAGAMAWMAPVQGAINAAAALAAGYAQVQKIMSVDTSGNASSGGGMATALAMPNIEGLNSPIDYTRQVTTQTEQEEMNRDNRVYILESDIQESNTRVRVREEETTF